MNFEKLSFVYFPTWERICTK